MEFLENWGAALPWDRLVLAPLPLKALDAAIDLARSGQWPRVAIRPGRGLEDNFLSCSVRHCADETFQLVSGERFFEEIALDDFDFLASQEPSCAHARRSCELAVEAWLGSDHFVRMRRHSTVRHQ